MGFNREVWLKNGKRWTTHNKRSPGPGVWTEERLQKLADLRAAGKRAGACAEALHMTHAAVKWGLNMLRLRQDEITLADLPVPPSVLKPWPKEAVFQNITRAEARLVRECCKRGSV